MFGFSYLFLSGFLWTSVLADECPYKECYCAAGSILCDDMYLNEIPQLLVKKNNYIETLSMERNNIITIPAGRLPSNLSQLSMQDNPVETIDPAAFDDSLNTLETLSFSNARFTQLPEAVLHLNVLKNLNLSNITILVWNEDAMKRFGPTMETLKLDSVGLTKWPDFIKSFTHLTYVDLGHNFITQLTDTSFPKGSAITQLLLNHNPLSKISPLAFKNLANLQELDLQYSKLTRLPLAIASLTNLEEINLTGSTHLVCTCNEKSLGTMIQTLRPDNVLGNCGHISIYTFFTQRSPRCP